jgi:hypothetical protein
MDLDGLWEHACKKTEILRMRLQDLPTFAAATVPYVFLAESALNQGDTVMRRGQVVIQRPSLILPRFSPQFEGFTPEDALPLGEHALSTFLLVRGIQFPSLKYRHQTSSLDVLEQPLPQAVRTQLDRLQRAEDVHTGLLIGPEEAWQFSVLLLTGALVIRAAEGDLRRILEAWRKRQEPGAGTG